MKRRSRALDRYQSMRDFRSTDEPSGVVTESRTGRAFVVQKHDATRLHYDFRLELDGVLLSWAVPKGPSLSPKDRRLAVRTEDHPVDYMDFEGNIPHGQYGGGPVIVWDRGTWKPLEDPHEGLSKGRLDFSLHGEKLHGRFMLVRTRRDDRGKEQWLLFKRDDVEARSGEQADIVTLRPESVLTGRLVEEVEEGVPRPTKKTKRSSAGATAHAAVRKKAGRASGAGAAKKVPGRTAVGKPARRPSKLPASSRLSPQLATLVSEVPRGPGWLFEVKYDGYRALAFKNGEAVRIVTRGGQDWTDRYTAIADALSRIRVDTAVIDGEIAYVLPDGRTTFQKLPKARPDDPHLVFHAFDLLFADGADLRDEPLTERKAILRTVLAGEKPPLRFADHQEGSGEAFFAEACKLGLEGIIGKRADAPYTEKRTKDWVKLKCQNRQEMVIVGFTPPKGSRKGLGALLLGVHEGKRLEYAGKVGTGFSQSTLAELHGRLAPLAVDAPAVVNAPRMRDVTWVEPKLVAEVRFTEWTDGGALRHPSFEGLREDKPASRVKREVERRAPTTESTSRRRSASTATSSPRANANGSESIAGVSISHPGRVIDADTGATKADLARYFEAVGPWMIPYAKHRPLMLVRAPRGVGDGTFVQRHHGGRRKPAIERPDEDGHIGVAEAGSEPVMFVKDVAGLVELVQGNAIEFHGWGSIMPHWEKPNWVVFDFDPDEGLPFDRVVDAARELREILQTLGLQSFCKTTGGKGLHVVVPLAARHEWETIRTFASAVAGVMVAQSPKRFVAVASKARRRGKIFIDWLRNGEGATAILPYSTRARPGLPVAMPVAWDDLGRFDPADFNVTTAADFITRRKKDPWETMTSLKQTIRKDVLDVLRGEGAHR